MHKKLTFRQQLKKFDSQNLDLTKVFIASEVDFRLIWLPFKLTEEFFEKICEYIFNTYTSDHRCTKATIEELALRIAKCISEGHLTLQDFKGESVYLNTLTSLAISKTAVVL